MKLQETFFIFLVFASCGIEIMLARVIKENLEVDIPHIGSIIGREGSSANLDITIYEFLGIPYVAKPERFKAPTAFATWSEPLHATTAAPACPQLGDGLPLPFSAEFAEALFPGAAQYRAERASQAPRPSARDPEDCLTLDIYTPTTSQEAQLPVFVFIHGGAFVFGWSSMASGAYLLEHEQMVLVSVQYRLGPMGFLAAEEADAPGNGALHDLDWALKWVKEHIRYFGGNPEHIVVGGVSAGAALSGMLAVSPRTRDMVVGAALFSGGALSPWAVDADPLLSTRSVGVFAGCFDLDSLAECLRSRKPAVLNIAWGAWTVYAKYFKNHGMGGVIPTVNPSDSILPRHPREEMLDAGFKGKPMLIGVTKHEGTFVLSQMDIFYMKARNLTKDQRTLDYEMGDLLVEFSDVDDHLNVFGDAVKRLYFSKETIGNYTAMFEGLVDFTGAGFFKGPAQRMARMNAEAGGESFLYSFDYARENASAHLIFGGSPSTVHHGSDQNFLFPGRKKLTEQDHQVADIYSKLVAKFVVNLKPEIKDVEWHPYSLENDYYMSISLNPKASYGFSDQFYIMETERREQEIETEPPTDPTTEFSSTPEEINSSPNSEPSTSSESSNTGLGIPSITPLSMLLLIGSLTLIILC